MGEAMPGDAEEDRRAIDRRLDGARVRLRLLNSWIADWERNLALPGDAIPDHARPTLQRHLEDYRAERAAVVRAIGEMERRRDQAAELWERRN